MIKEKSGIITAMLNARKSLFTSQTDGIFNFRAEQTWRSFILAVYLNLIFTKEGVISLFLTAIYLGINVALTLTTLLDPPLCFYRKLKVRKQKSIRIQEKIVYATKLSGFQGLGFKVPTLNSGYNFSRNMTKPGSFYFGFVHLYVNGEVNQILKRSGFVTNSEQFPLM